MHVYKEHFQFLLHSTPVSQVNDEGQICISLDKLSQNWRCFDARLLFSFLPKKNP